LRKTTLRNAKAILKMTLRAEFEPLRLSWYGFHRGPAACKRAWDCGSPSPEKLAAEVARATAWLSLWPKTKGGNRKAGSSYSLKHVAERRHQTRTPGRDYYIGNGSLLMAARRLGFAIEPTGSWSGDERDFCNGWIGIATAAGSYPRYEAQSYSQALRRFA
jgi:hypothetical protein